ncbi:MAG: class I SAM-dependent RNA methyltransferase [Polyangiaceae bacterium]|nr:class I SAM-dependent RNA methyltransferase [Polyangiaceae bacterium]
MTALRLYATHGVGVETLVSRELAELGIRVDRLEPGRARFDGSLDDLYRALIHLRCASRVVREIGFAELTSERDLYDLVRSLDWGRWMHPNTTFRVHLNAHSSLFRNTRFAQYRVKDAICDWFQDQAGRRPSVDLVCPNLPVYCYLENRRFSIGLDAAGDPLHMRGYRVAQHAASLREHLAAALVLHAGWTPPKPLHDPFCGSGTVLIEAAMIATRTPASYRRTSFGCEHWPDFDPERFAQLRQQAAQAVQWVDGLIITGADRDQDAVELAKRNVASAGFGEHVRVQACSVDQMPAIHHGCIVTNPPYGVRVGQGRGLADTFRAFRERALACTGSSVTVLHADETFEKAFSLRPTKSNRLNNGPLRCTVTRYDIRA